MTRTTKQETTTEVTPREAAYAQEGITDPDDPKRHMVAFVTENEAGYQTSTYTGTLTYCQSVAETINAARGLTKREALDVVSSSFAAQNTIDPVEDQQS